MESFLTAAVEAAWQAIAPLITPEFVGGAIALGIVYAIRRAAKLWADGDKSDALTGAHGQRLMHIESMVSDLHRDRFGPRGGM